jgi:hypothetical protein
VFVMVVERVEIRCSTLSSCWIWCWCKMVVRWDMQFLRLVSHSFWCSVDSWTQGCMSMVRPFGVVWLVMCLFRTVTWRVW